MTTRFGTGLGSRSGLGLRLGLKFGAGLRCGLVLHRNEEDAVGEREARHGHISPLEVKDEDNEARQYEQQLVKDVTG